MDSVSYDVELIHQEQNPICWIACCAMVKGFGTKASVGVGEFTGGFDPSNSSIANLAGNWSECTRLIQSWGFEVLEVSDLGTPIMDADGLVAALQSKGPAVLLHLCRAFPYGFQWGDSSLMKGAHAVVLTGGDTRASDVTFNNPWGDKDQSADLGEVLRHINNDASIGKTIAFWPDLA